MDKAKSTIGPVHTRTLVMVVLAVAMAEIFFRVASRHENHSALWILAASRFFEGVLIMGILFFGKAGLSKVGLSSKTALSGFWRGLLWSIGFGGATFAVFGSLALMGIDPLLFIKTPLPFKTGDVILFFLVGGVISPITEELFFRGVLYGFMRRWGATAAVVLSSLMFVWAHHMAVTRFSWIQLVGGVVFVLAYEKEKNLMVPITLHTLGNMAIFTLSLMG